MHIWLLDSNLHEHSNIWSFFDLKLQTLVLSYYSFSYVLLSHFQPVIYPYFHLYLVFFSSFIWFQVTFFKNSHLTGLWHLHCIFLNMKLEPGNEYVRWRWESELYSPRSSCLLHFLQCDRIYAQSCWVWSLSVLEQTWQNSNSFCCGNRNYEPLSGRLT